MGQISQQFLDIGYLDTLASGDSPVHRLDPRVKLITTLAFIATVVSFDKYSVSELIPFVIFPAVQISIAGLPAGYLLKKVLWVSPFAVMVGIFNPLIDQDILLHIGSIGISGGWVSFSSILIRCLLTVTSALILIASTGFDTLCAALQKLGVPRPFVVQLMFLYRYIFVLMDEAARMVRAISLRSFNSGAMHFRIFVPMMGHLLLRTLDRSQRIHLAMKCRGFDGHIRVIRFMKIRSADIFFATGCLTFFLILKYCNISYELGHLITRLIQ
jgi:cobalt/nickel transport system permease protein